MKSENEGQYPPQILSYTPADIVILNFNSADLFEKNGIDYCYGGNISLRDALKEKGLDETAFETELKRIFTQSPAPPVNFDAMGLVELSEYIINTHHTFVRRSIPLISQHLENIIKNHGGSHSYLLDVQNSFSALTAELNSHMFKEERVLFPLIKYLVDSKKFQEKPKARGYGSIKSPIKQMEDEHSRSGQLFDSIREKTNNLTAPDEECTPFGLTYKELDDFEKDLHKHIHLENNILFPKAIELEQTLLNTY